MERVKEEKDRLQDEADDRDRFLVELDRSMRWQQETLTNVQSLDNNNQDCTDGMARLKVGNYVIAQGCWN